MGCHIVFVETGWKKQTHQINISGRITIGLTEVSGMFHPDTAA
jgi:hypothetical protein